MAPDRGERLEVLFEELLEHTRKLYEAKSVRWALGVASLQGAVLGALEAGAIGQDHANAWMRRLRKQFDVPQPAHLREIRHSVVGLRPVPISSEEWSATPRQQFSGHQLVAVVAPRAIVGDRLTVNVVEVYSDGLAVRWYFEPERPWRPKESPPPGLRTWEGHPPKSKPPPPLDLSVDDGLGTSYWEAGTSIAGTVDGWRGETTFVPAPPHDADSLLLQSPLGSLTVELPRREGLR
jgi:hypothetical protein